ncbi:MAG: lamin tail domain-containing protein [Bacteroidales bacterium]
MKKISLLIIILLVSGFTAFTFAQVDVTFQVDMANEDAISPDGVHVAGSFQDEAGYPGDWDPSTTELTQVGATTVYAITVTLPEGYYEFKYVNGNAWGSDENIPGGCSQNGNRFINVGTDPMVLEAVCFGSCTVCAPPEVDVTFQVNMAQQTVPGPVHIAGSFQGWDPAATEMTLAYDAVYTYTTSLPVGEYIEYKFINGNAWGGDESVPGCCNSNGNRYLSVPDEDLVVDVVCFASCTDCTLGTVDVTFQVDMNNETVSPEGVHIVGSFQNWAPGDTPMIDAGNGVYTYTTTLDKGACIEYKFINGDEWGEDESVPGECALGFNRYLIVPEANSILDPVCYAACSPCEGGTADLFISEYAEGSSNNKYVEIFNGTGAPVDLSNYNVHRIANGGEWTENVYPLSGILDHGDVYVIANANADAYILDRADETSALTFYNGDDAVGLSKNTPDGWEIIDGVGQDGPDPGSGWEVAGVSNATAEHTLIRKSTICAPNADWASSAGTDADNSEWIVQPQDYWSELGFHVAVCGGTPVAEMPSFSHPSGTYFSAFDLEISSATANAVIYYTTDGSDPDNTSMEYTGPINVSTNTTVKAIAYAPGYQTSFVSEVTLNFEDVTQVANLAELRAMFTSDVMYYEVTGEVVLTFQQDFRNQKYVQDASAAILIDDNSGVITTAYEVGDGITGLIGTLNEYGNMLQFVPALDPGAPTSTGNVITPEVITINEMVTNFEEYEAELVQILDVIFADGGELFETGTEYPISDASKAEGTFRTTFYDVNYIGTPVPPAPSNITGICNSRFNGNFITSRSLDDIVVPPSLLVLNPNGGEQIEQNTEFEITWSAFDYEGTIDIELVNEINSDVEVLATEVPVDNGSYTWNVVQDYGDNYKIHITATNGGLDDYSDDFFSIIPPIDIRITEIMYNPPNHYQYYEFVEFYNNGEGTVNLQDWEITQGVSFTFPEHFIAPGEYVVVSANTDEFLALFGVNSYQFSGGLSNGGEDIELTDNNGQVRAYVDYDDGGDWYPVTDGEGPSLTYCDMTLENNDPASWSVSTYLAAISEDEGMYATPGMGCNENPALPVWYEEGWNGISSNLVIEDKMMLEELFAPAYKNFMIMLGQQGIFWPGQNINTIGEWDTYKGYKAKFDDDTYFVFPGEYPETRDVVLQPGTYFIPVLSEGPVSVEDVIMPLGDAIEFMFDIHYGGVYWPGGGILPGMNGSLETLFPGYAYLARVNYEVTLEYFVPAIRNASRPVPAINNTTWNDAVSTGNQHIVSIAETALQQLEAGDVIGAFNTDGICVGMATYGGDETALPLAVYGDDATTGEIDGMKAMEKISYRIFSQGEETEVMAVYNMNLPQHDGLFVENGLSMITDLKAGATGIGEQQAAYSIYPNPGNGLFNIDINGTFDVEVTNAQGQLIRSERINGSSTLDLSSQPEGVYFIKLTNETTSLIEKVIIR